MKNEYTMRAAVNIVDKFWPPKRPEERVRYNQVEELVAGALKDTLLLLGVLVEDLPGERWRTIARYEGRYKISDMGRVKSLIHTKPPRHMEKWGSIPRSEGILQGSQCLAAITLHEYAEGETKKQKGRSHSVAKLVWETFVGPVGDGMAIKKLDNNIRNCKLDNLELMTKRDLMLRLKSEGIVP